MARFRFANLLTHRHLIILIKGCYWNIFSTLAYIPKCRETQLLRSPMYEARKICNLLLANFDAVDFDITNLRINKLLFFIHAESLVERPEGLIRNHFEAWQFGPVIRPVFDAFKVYGEKPIREPARYLDYASGETIPVPYEDIRSEDVELILREFLRYNRFTTGQLVQLSHETGGPWDLVYRAWLADGTRSQRISNELIRSQRAGERISTTRH